MSEHYEIINHARGKPRAAGCVGVRVLVPLSGCPSRRWTHAFGGHLVTELTGHAAVGHLRINLDELVHGDQIVLEGVEPGEASALGEPLRRAVDAANRAEADQANRPPNVTQAEADAVASQIPLNASGPEATTAAGHDPPCPRCGEPVPVTGGNPEAGSQLALAEMDCPSCGARLVRDVEGHVDRGWRLAD